ncbi:MAG: hypothetical protein AUH42_04220 [Gemmatimonadetes bacterium 13_1_40CM_70_11]|nr:MAG: hypothetical protein AUH42_04220 [Gemmatimonadetes bacterium 13_1_40CM_70_11]
MLSPPEADLVRRDAALPALATVLDPEAFVAALPPALAATDVRAASIRYVRYKPHTNCLVAYRLDVGRAAVEPLHAYAKAHRLDAAEKLRKARRSGPGRMVLADRALVISLFPTDGRLKAMRRLTDAGERPRLLRDLLSDRPDWWTGTVRTLRYKPERRYVARLETPDGIGAVLKVHLPEWYRRAADSAAAFASHHAVRVPRLLGRSAHHRTVALEWLPGRLLSEALGSAADVAAAATVGTALGELHRQRPVGLAAVEPEAEAADLTALGADIAFVCPRLARSAQDLAARLAARVTEASNHLGPIHGDFYAGQVLLDGGAVAIFDLDRAAWGDPAADLGTFVAHLERDALRGALPADRVTGLSDALLEGYRTVASRPAPARLRLYTAVGLFRLAPEPFRTCEPDWPDKIAAVIARAAAVAEAG